MATRDFEGTDHAAVYAKLRTSPPNRLIDRVIEYLKEKLPPTGNNVSTKAKKWQVAVDVWCGSGQCTVLLSPLFEQVYGFDVSPAQVTEANKANQQENVVYQASPAETIPLPDGSVDLITAAESMHWFDLNAFFPEVKRLLRPNGVFAAFGYPVMRPYVKGQPNNESLVNVLKETYSSPILAKHWSKQLKLVDNKYTDITFPFRDTLRGSFEGCLDINGEEMVRYIHTWSGFQKCLKDDPQGAQKLVDRLSARIRYISGKESLREVDIELLFDYFLVLNRV